MARTRRRNASGDSGAEVDAAASRDVVMNRTMMTTEMRGRARVGASSEDFRASRKTCVAPRSRSPVTDASRPRVARRCVTRRDETRGESSIVSRPPTRARDDRPNSRRVERCARDLYALLVHRRDASTRSPTRARVRIETRARRSPRARRRHGVRPTAMSSRFHTVRLRTPSMRNSNGHVRAPFYIPLSMGCLYMRICLLVETCGRP